MKYFLAISAESGVLCDILAIITRKKKCGGK
jgi:hypothetical protein